jgi:FAD:protein FMN transferase
MKKYNWLFFAVLAAAMVLFLGLTRREAALQTQTRFLLDTYYTIKAPGKENVRKVIGKALDRVEEIDTKFNALNPASPLYGFNNSNTPISDREIVELVRIALDLSEKSGGKYDITVFPLVDLWGFFKKSPDIPRTAELDSLMKTVGYKKLKIENGILTKTDPNCKIDLGSIAKGYSVGEALKVLKAGGIASALIDAGGDIYALGMNNGRPWKIGIRDPRGDGMIGSVEVTDKTVVTSGDYERFFEKDGVRYHHILDPQTGFPSRGIISATIISSDPTLADGWSTALFVMGREKGFEAIEAAGSTEALIVTEDGEKFSTPGTHFHRQTAQGR